MNKVIITTCIGSEIVAKTKYDINVLFKHVPYCFIIRHKDNNFLRNFYHGEKGVNLESDTYKRIHEIEKKYANYQLHKLLGAKLYTVPMDGRKKEARKLPYYTIDMLLM